ncbi:DUF4209 domain-containing protein [Anthocerotibacter panamensis]|uniref:DUF4209 domain-containing protein n=1 Tax=Anthocerotibacter panamensis TaxID=2857077 RepID=UPI001C401463|nr:DUF4209 domain-containing protein [Anthocerotibacter panamensis]
MQRYPENIHVNIEDFRRSDWKSAIDSRAREDYPSMWQSLSAAARAAIESGEIAEGKVLWLLADACSMMLNPRSANEPFKPFMVMNGKRSSVPEDFQQSDVTLFAQIAEEIDDIWLQARLADLVWLLKRPRSPQHALLAIDAYRKIPLDAKTWVRGGRECWERALSLTWMLRAGAGERIKEMEVTIISAFEAAKAEDGFLALWLTDLLATNHLGHDYGVDIARKLESLARSFDAEGDLHSAREFFAASAKWFQQTGDDAKATEITVCVAEGWVKEAVARMSSAQPSHMVAASFYENAIQTYRSIPRSKRAIHRIDERIAELHRRLNEAGERSLDEMGIITSPSMDITELIEKAQNAVRDKTTLDALAAFANIYRGARVAQIREFAEKMLREHPLQALVSATHMSRDGRVIAKRPGMGFGDAHSNEYQATLWAEMVRHYGMELSIVVQGDIWPALEILILEHRLRESDFIAIATRSPIVPTGRERLFGKALFAGCEKDFVVALHLLVPQIEHMVRWHLKATGIKTTTLDKDGIENENGLSTLMDLPEATQILGEDVSFELKALFCDAFGPNLRNELAHGLLDDEACQSTYAIYAWWLGLRLVFNTFWNAKRKASAGKGEDEKP